MAQEEEYAQVHLSRLESRIRSREDLFCILKDSCKCLIMLGKFAVPIERQCTVRFMKDVLLGKKKVSRNVILIADQVFPDQTSEHTSQGVLQARRRVCQGDWKESRAQGLLPPLRRRQVQAIQTVLLGGLAYIRARVRLKGSIWHQERGNC